MITQTPGVYIQEKNIIPASVAGVSTAVPLFIGFTEKPQVEPVRITSLFEFETHFGGAYVPNYAIDISSSHEINSTTPDKRLFLYETLALYFTNGGGPCYIMCANTYAPTSLTVDNATTTFTGLTNTVAAATDLTNTLTVIDKLDEVTLVLMPDLHCQITGASISGVSQYSTLVSTLINTCGNIEDKKFTILDYHEQETTADQMRDWLTPTTDNLKYAAVYYPWLKNSATASIAFSQLNLPVNYSSGSGVETDLSTVIADISALNTKFSNLQTVTSLQEHYNSLSSDVSSKPKLTSVFTFLYGLIKGLDSTLALSDASIDTTRNSLGVNTLFVEEVKKLFWFADTLGEGTNGLLSQGFPVSGIIPNAAWISQAFNQAPNQYADYAALVNDSANLNYTAASTNPAIITDLNNEVDLNIIFTGIASLFDTALAKKVVLETQVLTTDPVYINIQNSIKQEMKKTLSQGAIAGIYCKTDRERGVWKSPANVSVQGIEKPLVEVSNSIQDGLNVDANTGKSINVIRTFTGKGPLVWGARTLAGQDNEWRYISVRRFFNYAEESIKKAMNSFVFEPNNARTWVKINAMVTSFLVEQWRAGALVGNATDEAFFVRVGEDTTTTEEILLGKINVQIGMAVVRPAEFIIIEFSHNLTNQ